MNQNLSPSPYSFLLFPVVIHKNPVKMSSICSSLGVMAPQWSHNKVRFLIFLHSKRKIDFSPRIISSSINDDSIFVPKQPQAISLSLSLPLSLALSLSLFIYMHIYMMIFYLTIVLFYLSIGSWVMILRRSSSAWRLIYNPGSVHSSIHTFKPELG